MGAGHDLAAAELARRLEARGYRTRTEDYLSWFPLRIGLLLRWVYGQQLKVAPWTYEATFRLWIVVPLMCRVLEVILGLLTGRRMRRLVADSGPAVIVCAYPLQALVLGRLRRKGRVGVPLVTFITDFGVHPLWMHEGVDLTVCVWEGAARAAATSTSRTVVSTGPMVAPAYAAGPLPKAVARAGLGLPQEGRIALVVAGSWGVGDIEATFAELWATGRYLPVAVCGRNESVRQSLAAKGYGVVLGWTDRMHELMSAADVLVQNAGGLSCMEAFSLDLPVVTYHPIAGHGRKNASEMVAAGVTLLATGPDDLGAVLDRATGPQRASLVAAGRAVFSGDPAAEVDRLARAAADAGERSRVRAPHPVPVPVPVPVG
ncbi:MAG: MGDG synthase family glycosyltransferase, partial [Acidimicrobiales bacterium]